MKQNYFERAEIAMDTNKVIRYILIFSLAIMGVLSFVTVIFAIFSYEVPEIILKMLFVVLAFFIPVVLFIALKELM